MLNKIIIIIIIADTCKFNNEIILWKEFNCM